MKIIDTHLHCWDLQKLDYYWLKGDTSLLAKNYFVEDIRPEMEKSGVTGAVLVQATNSIEETDWFLQLAAHNDWILGAVGWLPLQQPAEVERLLSLYKLNPFFKGVRHQIHDEADDAWLLQPTVLESLRMLMDADVPYDLVGIKPAHIATALKLAEKLPNLRMVFDHINQAPFKEGLQGNRWTELMKEAATHPQFFAKISGLGTGTGKPFEWTDADVAPFVEFILKGFGTSRVFCGGDWPVSLLAGSYTYTWQQYKATFDRLLTDEEKIQVYEINAEKFYGLNQY